MGKPRPSWILRPPPDPRMGPLIASARRAKGLTLRAVGERAGVSERYVKMLQAGTRTPSGAVAAALGRVLDIEVPLPPAPPHRETRSERRDRQRADEARRMALMREVQEFEASERLRQSIWPTSTFGRRF